MTDTPLIPLNPAEQKQARRTALFCAPLLRSDNQDVQEIVNAALDEYALDERAYVEHIRQYVQQEGVDNLASAVAQTQIKQIARFYKDLSQSANQETPELLIAALSEYGYDEAGYVEEIAHRLLAQRSDADHPCPPWKRVAITTASNINNAPLLTQALQDSASDVQSVAVRHSFIYWQRNLFRDEDPSALQQAFVPLEKIMENSIRFLVIPQIQNLKASFVLSLLILFEAYSKDKTDQERGAIIEKLRSLWRPAIERLLWINPEKLDSNQHHWQNRLRTMLFTGMVQSVLQFLFLATSAYQGSLTVKEFQHFFKKDKDFKERRAIAQKIAYYIDINKDINDLRDDLLALTDRRDFLISLLAAAALQRHMIAHPEKTVRIVQDIVTRAMADKEKPGPFTRDDKRAPGPFTSLVPHTALFSEGFRSDTVRKTYLKVMSERLTRFEGIWHSALGEHRNTYLDVLSLAELDRSFVDDGLHPAGSDSAGTSRLIPDSPAITPIDHAICPEAKKHIENMIQKKDYQWMQRIVSHDVTVRAIQTRWFRFTFSVLHMLIEQLPELQIKEGTRSPSSEQNQQEEIVKLREQIVELLTRMRVYDPNRVDEFCEQQNLEKTVLQHIRTHPQQESLGDILPLRLHIFIENAIVYNESEDLWQRVIWVIEQIADSRSFEQWMTTLMKVAVNLIYGRQVFVDVHEG